MVELHSIPHGGDAPTPTNPPAVLPIGVAPLIDAVLMFRPAWEVPIDFIANVFAGAWAAGVLAAIWYVRMRPSPPIAESQQDRDLREWLGGQL
ncbi:MAG: hypothetical protein E5X64_15850 [Mesorhizobium sp.]|nr:MAG: hypothetical protein E5X64_15850 [Mesorhizobium sp.]